MTDPLSSSAPWLVLLFLAIGYAFGSVPFGLLFTRKAGLGDIRSIGSKNIGATNVLRTGRKDLAAATLLADALKGTAAVLLAWYVTRQDAPAMAAAAGAFLGHVFPVWLRFRGGKGVATFIGVLLAASWLSALIFGAVWLFTAFATRYSSLAALVASAVTPVIVFLLLGLPWAAVFLLLAVILIAKHGANIRRLVSGSESKIGAKPSAASP